MLQRPQSPHLMDTYGRYDITLTHGEGMRLYDAEGKEYLDFLAGIAVVSAGHINSLVTDAIQKQSSRLTHVSNYFSTEPMVKLAERLCDISDMDKVFFANSGAEANECAIKIARKWSGPGRYKTLCAYNSFHGRTLASLAATGQPDKWESFGPMPDGFVHCDFNSIDSFSSALTPDVAAVLIEPIQGEGGVIPADPEFLRDLRQLCTESGVALIFDEVQTGVGRTGHWWAYQGYEVVPDILTSAKALGNGMPIGACLARDEFADVLQKGDHGSTFGGNPVAAAAALATLSVIEEQIPTVAERGEYLKNSLTQLPYVTGVRGKGLMLGAVLDSPRAKEISMKALEKGLIVNALREDVLRLTPPLIVSKTDIEQAHAILASISD